MNIPSRISTSTAYRVSKREIVPALIPCFIAILTLGLISIAEAYVSQNPSPLKVSIPWRIVVLLGCMAFYSVFHLTCICYHNSRKQQTLRELLGMAVVTLRMIREPGIPETELNPNSDLFGFGRVSYALPRRLRSVLNSFAQVPEGAFFVAGIPLLMILLLKYVDTSLLKYSALFSGMSLLISLGSYMAYRVYAPGRILVTPVGFLIEKETRATFYPWHLFEKGEWKDGIEVSPDVDGESSVPAHLELRLSPTQNLSPAELDYAVEIPMAEERELLLKTVSANMILETSNRKRSR